MLELGGDRDSVNARSIRNGPDQRAVVGVDYVYLGAVREIQTSRNAIDGDIVESAVTRNRIAGLDLVSCTALPRREKNRHPNDSRSNAWHELFLSIRSVCCGR